MGTGRAGTFKRCRKWVCVADGEKQRGGRTLVGVLSSWEQSSDVESRSSSEELMKHRPQGSLGDSSCQDWREERGNVQTRTQTHTHRWVSKDTQQVSAQTHMVKSENTVKIRNKSVERFIFSPAGSMPFYRQTAGGTSTVSTDVQYVRITQDSKKFIINDTWTHRLVTAVTQ